MDMKSLLIKDIKDALKNLDVKYTDDIIVIEEPKNKNNGDFSCNIAMKLSGLLKDNPMNIADKVVSELKKNDNYEVSAAIPGFINFVLTNKFVFSGIKTVLEENDNYGKNNYGKGKKINIEYVSANPTGILHLGTARGAAYGSNLANIMSFSGYDVTREYYINDAGNQIDNLGKSIKERYKGLCGLEESMPEDGYYGKEIIDIATQIKDEYKDSKLSSDLDFYKELGVDYLLGIIKNDLRDFGVIFDVWTSEKKIRAKGRIEESIEKLDKDGLIYKQDDAVYLKTTNYGDDKDRVLIKSDGSYTYLVPDIAYHLDKFDRGFDNLIDVFGADHHSYVSRLKASIEALGYDKDKLTVKLLQMVRLLKNGEIVKMSKRTGNSITIRELVDEIGKDAARYFFATRSLDSQMDLDIGLAVKNTNENPLFYVQYAHARICSILKDASESNIEITNDISQLDIDSKALMLKVYDFPEIVKLSSSRLEPHLVTNYVYELASMFHNYYGKHKILKMDDITETSERLALIKAVKITINNALRLIGVKAIEKM